MNLIEKDDFNIFKHNLQINDFCKNDSDLEGFVLNITEEIINQHNNNLEKILRSNMLLNISKIEKFKDFCNKDIFNDDFSYNNDYITDFLFIIYRAFDFKDLFINTPTIETFKIKKYYLLIFIILGLLGNCLSAIVFFRKKIYSFSFSIYLGVLAISDMSFSLMILIQWLRIMEIEIEIKMSNLYWLNYFEIFLVYFLKFLSVWLIIAFIMERYVVTKYPFRRQSWCTVKRAKIVVITLIVLAILYSVLYVFLENTPRNMTDQDIKIFHIFNHVSSESTKQDSNIHVITNAIIMFTLPALIIIMFNTLIGWHIYQQNLVNKTLISISTTSSERAQISENEMSDDCENKITKMLILVSSIFVILKLPAHIHFFIGSNIYKYGINWTVMYEICDLLNITKYSVNFVFYCAEQTFRRELICMFTKRTNIERNENIMKMDNYK